MAGMYLTAVVGLVLLLWQLRLIPASLKGELPSVTQDKYLFGRVVEEVIKDLNRRWLLGDDGELWQQGAANCQDVLGPSQFVSYSYLACNPGMIECLGRNQFKFKASVDKNNYQVQFSPAFKNSKGEQRYYQLLTHDNGSSLRRPDNAIEIELISEQFPGLVSRLLLEDICGMAYLPHGKYAYGPQVKNKSKNINLEWNWDNHGRFIYIDKHLVTNRDLLDWLDFGAVEPAAGVELRAGLSGKVLAAPATHLTTEQMERYCAFRGKQVLQAHIYDAATFMPFKNDTETKVIHRGPYPWSIKETDGHLYQAIKDGNFNPTKEACQIVYSSECIGELPLEHRGKLSNSWTGLYQILGGYLEYMKNQIEPDKNLKMSSFYFPVDSGWHRLGMRSYWDGLGHQLENFAPNQLPDINGAFEVGFRCMKELERGN